MAEIQDGKFIRNETNENSMGGTERITENIDSLREEVTKINGVVDSDEV